MAKKGEGDALISGETEAWNVAEGFVKLKILRLLVQLDRYENIATFGTEEIDQDNVFDSEGLAKRRIEGFQRYIFSLKQLIGNVKFALKKEGINSSKYYMERIDNIESYMDGIFREDENEVTHEVNIIINEDLFKKCMIILKQIKDDFNIPMNKAGLIFRETDEVDLDKIMREIAEAG